MTLKTRLVSLIQKWAAELGISDYKFDFNLVSDREMNGDYARVDTDDITREVLVEFNRLRLTKEPNEVEKSVVHELLHVRLNEQAEFIIDLLKTYVPSPKTRKMLLRQAEKLEHKIVVAISDSLIKERK